MRSPPHPKEEFSFAEDEQFGMQQPALQAVKMDSGLADMVGDKVPGWSCFLPFTLHAVCLKRRLCNIGCTSIDSILALGSENEYI